MIGSFIKKWFGYGELVENNYDVELERVMRDCLIIAYEDTERRLRDKIKVLEKKCYDINIDRYKGREHYDR
jgi:hypothetical protein